MNTNNNNHHHHLYVQGFCLLACAILEHQATFFLAILGALSEGIVCRCSSQCIFHLCICLSDFLISSCDLILSHRVYNLLYFYMIETTCLQLPVVFHLFQESMFFHCRMSGMAVPLFYRI